MKTVELRAAGCRLLSREREGGLGLLAVVLCLLILPPVAVAVEPVAELEISNREMVVSGRGGFLPAYLGPLLSPNGRILAAGITSDAGNVIKLWDARTGKVVAVMRREQMLVPEQVLAFSPDGKKLLTVSMLGQLGLWDLAGRSFEMRIKLPSAIPMPGIPQPRAPAGIPQGVRDMIDGVTSSAVPFQIAAFSPSGKHLVIERGFDMLLWKVGGNQVQTLRSGGGVPRGGRQTSSQGARGRGKNYVTRLTFSGDGQSLVAIMANGEVRRRRIRGGKSKVTIPANEYPFSNVSALSTGGGRMAARTQQEFFVLSVADGKELFRTKLKKGTAAMSGDGRRVAYSRGSRGIDIADVDSGDRSHEIKLPQKTLTGMMLSENGEVLITDHRTGRGTGGADSRRGTRANIQMRGKIYIWNLTEQETNPERP